jgi:hypothetical protein
MQCSIASSSSFYFLHEQSPNIFITLCFCGRIVTVDLRAVTRLQKGQTTIRFDRTKGKLSDVANLSFSLMMRDGSSCCLVAYDEPTFDMWYCGIEEIVKAFMTEKLNESADVRFYRAKWDLADEDNDGELSKREVIRLVNSINVRMSRKEVLAMYERVDVDNSDGLNFDEFCVFMNLLRER